MEQNVAYGLKRRGYDPTAIQARVTEMLELVKLVELRTQRPGLLSGGQQQRVALARALATSPEIILLDEPLSALDAKLRQELRVELKQILSAVNATTIVVTHDQEEAMSLGDTVIVMNRGSVIQEGPPTEIYQNPKTRFVAEFIGRSNWFEGIVGEAVSDEVYRFNTTKGLSLLVLIPNHVLTGNERYEVCVRPERISITTSANARQKTKGINRHSGTVLDIAHLGSDVHLVIALESGDTITVSEHYSGQALEQSGKQVEIEFYPEDCITLPANS